jgi:hypothetical protein
MPRITDANRLQGRDVPRPEATDDQKALTYDQPTEMLKWKAPAAGGGGGTSQTDGAAFALGTDPFTPAGGVFDDSPPADLTQGKTAVARITKKRAFHFNLRDSAGLEIGTAAAPLRTDPTGTTPQPVTGTFFPVTQPISATSLPLPTGAATETTLGTVLTNTGRIPTAPATDRATAAAPFAMRASDGTAFIDPRDTLDRAVRLLGVVYGSQGQQLKQTATNFNLQTEQAVGGTLIDPRDVSDRAGRLVGVVSATSLPLPTGAAQEHVTAASPHAVRYTDGAAFIDPRGTLAAPGNQQIVVGGAAVDPRDITDRAARVLGVATGPALTKGTQGASGYTVQNLKDAGRASIAITAEAVAGSASEAIITHTISRGGAATSTGTSYNVTVGKTFRLTAIVVAFIATTTTANTSRFRLRVNATGAALVTSPLQFSFRLGWESATFIANEAEAICIPIPDGFEVPGGGGLAITHQEAAANGTLDVSLIGFEF